LFFFVLYKAKVGRKILTLMILGDKCLSHEIIQEKGWKQLTNKDELEIICKNILSQNSKQVKWLLFLLVIGFFLIFWLIN